MSDLPQVSKKAKKSKKFKKKKTSSVSHEKTPEKVSRVLPEAISVELPHGKFFPWIHIFSQTIRNISRFDYFLAFFILSAIVIMMMVSYIVKITSYASTLKIADSYSVYPYPISSFVDPHITAEAYIVYETSSRVIVAGKNVQYRFTPASTAKIMTAAIALEKYPLNQIFTVPKIDSVVGSKMGLVSGEKMSVKNLLYGMLLPSGNDAAYTLAYNFTSSEKKDSGGQEKFIQAMNAKAHDLKLFNTHFVDPAGYTDENYTTPFDLARLTAYTLKNPIFASIVATKSIQITNSINTHTYFLKNLNEMLEQNEVTGVKTGFTNEAGGVLITSVLHAGHTYIIIVMKSLDRFGDSTQLLNLVVRNTTLFTY